MDVLNFINNGGQKTVPNPNYNPKSKKNIQPYRNNLHNSCIDSCDFGGNCWALVCVE